MRRSPVAHALAGAPRDGIVLSWSSPGCRLDGCDQRRSVEKRSYSLFASRRSFGRCPPEDNRVILVSQTDGRNIPERSCQGCFSQLCGDRRHFALGSGPSEVDRHAERSARSIIEIEVSRGVGCIAGRPNLGARRACDQQEERPHPRCMQPVPQPPKPCLARLGFLAKLHHLSVRCPVVENLASAVDPVRSS
jgi:hypothetical protein